MKNIERSREEAVIQRRGGGLKPDSAPTADETGGRSTGTFTGFGGGKFGCGGRRAGAVVKANYTKAGSNASVKASARYYASRENERGEREERETFSKQRDNLGRVEVDAHLDRADKEHEYHYRVTVSPGTDREAEGVDLKDYTREVMREVERQQRGRASYIAVEHAREGAHTSHGHVHAVVSTDSKLTREDLEKLRDHASRTWDEMREHARTLARDPTVERDLKEVARAREGGERQQEVRREGRDLTPKEPGLKHERTAVRTVERDDGGRER